MRILCNSRKIKLVCKHNEANKTLQFGRLYYRWKGIIEIGSDIKFHDSRFRHSSYYSSLRGSSIGTANGRPLWGMPLIWPHMACCTYQISWTVCIRSLNLLCTCWLRLKGGGAGLCNWGLLRLLLLPRVAARLVLGRCGWKRTPFPLLSWSFSATFSTADLESKSEGKLLYDWRFTASPSWRQAPSESRPEFFFRLNPCGHSPYVTSSLTRRWVCLFWICLAFRQVYISHIWHVIRVELFFLLHYTQVLCQYRLYRADHAYLTYLIPQRQSSHLNGRKRDHRHD
jgi:hypothetical protein